MKEERGVIQDVIGTAQLKDESRTKKYIRIALGCVGLAFFMFVIVMAVLRRYGG
jgi:hypothetical protein